MRGNVVVRTACYLAILAGCCSQFVATDAATAQTTKNAAATQLLEAANKNDTATVKKLINEGTSANTHTESGDSVLSAACVKKNYDLARWLIRRGADIDVTSLFVSDEQSHLPGFSAAQQEFVAYLLYTQLSRKGMAVPYSDSTAQVLFVKRIKQAVIENLKALGYELKDSKGWGVRLLNVNYAKADGMTFLLFCDVAQWTGTAMFEIATRTGKLFPVPPSIDTPTLNHAWLEGSAGRPTVLDLQFHAGKVLIGDFLVTLKDSSTVVAEHVNVTK